MRGGFTETHRDFLFFLCESLRLLWVTLCNIFLFNGQNVVWVDTNKGK